MEQTESNSKNNEQINKKNIELFTRLNENKGNDLLINKITNEICENNKGLVNKIAADYCNGDNILKQDLESEGIFALLDSINRYDINSGNSFSTYAFSKIKGKIIDERNKFLTSIYIPKAKLQIYNKIVNQKSNLEDELGYEISYDELWERKYKEKYSLYEFWDVIDLQNLKATGETNSEKTENADDENYNLSDENKFVDKSDLHNEPLENVDELKMILQGLSERNKKIIEWAYGLNGKEKKSQKKIAKKCKCSETTISRVIKFAKVQWKLRNSKNESINLNS